MAFILEGFISSNAVDIPGEITDPTSFPVTSAALVAPNNFLEPSFTSAALTGLACDSTFASLPAISD